MYKDNWTQPWSMDIEIYPKVHENPRAFFNSYSSILLEPLAHDSSDWSLPRADCIIDVHEFVKEYGISLEQRAEASHLLKSIHSFEFVFNLHLMRNISGITNELSQALQRSYQNIVNVITLVRVCKKRLQIMRNDG